MEREFASKGVAGTGLGLGIAGTALGLLNGNGLGSIFGGNGGGCCSENTPVNRYELDMAIISSAKDSKIALLEANIFTDQKLNDLRNYTDGRFIRQDSINLEQAVYNATNTGAISCLKGQVDMLQSLTKVIVPNSSICPGWGEVCVSIVPCDTAVAVAKANK